MIKKKSFISLILAATLAAGQFGVVGTTASAEEAVGSVSDGNAKSDNDAAEGEDQSPSEETKTQDTENDQGQENSDDAADENKEAEDSKTDETVAENGENPEDAANEDNSEPETDSKDSEDEAEDDTAVSDGNAKAQEADDEDDKHTYTTEFDHEEQVDGFGIKIHADKGILPDGVTVKIKHLSEDEEKELEEVIDEKSEYDLFYSTSFDISFFDEDDVEVQPRDGKVDMFFDASKDMVATAENCAVSDITVIHFEDDEKCLEVNSETEEQNKDHALTEGTDTDVYYDEEGNLIQTPSVLGSTRGDEHSMSVNFEADSFSIYSFGLFANYLFDPQVVNGEQLIELTDTEALNNSFYSYVQQAFTKAGEIATAESKCRVRLPQNGRYTLYPKDVNILTLKMDSNTTFDLNGSYILNGRCHGMIMGAHKDSDIVVPGGYGGFQNMAIVNGTLDANAFAFTEAGFVTAKFAHITGLTIENVNFPNSRGHSIEFAAAKNVKITGCTFEHYTHPGSPNDEAINIDATHEGWISLGSDAKPELMGPFDDYCCANVEIANCTFNDVYRAIGSHNSIVGHHHKNISIHDNIISNITNHAIGCPHYVNSRIYNNTITNVGRGIDSVVEGYAIAEADDYESKAENFTANLEITGNTITMASSSNAGYPYGIRVGGMTASNSNEIDDGTYYTSGYKISNNTLNGFENGVFIRYAKNSEIYDNTSNNCKNGYDISNGTEITSFNHNKAYNSWGTGILVRDYSRIVSNSGNVVDTAGDALVSIQNGSSAAIFLDSKYVIGIGETYEPRFFCGESEVTYDNSKKSAVKVTKAGKFKGKKKGTAVITATQDGCSGTVRVVSKKAPKKVKLPKKKNVKRGNTYQIKPKVNSGAGCGKYKFKSNNKKVAKVSNTGLVKAKKKGKAVITVTAYNGVKSTMVINVK